MAIILELIAAFILVITFGSVFQAPKKSLFLLGVTGALCWGSFIMAKYFTDNLVIASFLASIVVGICGEVFARIMKLPVTVFVIAGIIPLVPGVPAYDTMLFLIQGEYIQGVEKGITTLMIAAAIAFAIAIVSAGARYYKEIKAHQG
ncbi:threonine/serine exporter family protein [Orenia marismortui]|uniref:threonine/serine exporter family protein n=1 Tax=Orenia marismortui TaxID=46469 RepID=UPI0003652197|nr:threonine/serine exporter family protein [Orenia marismortui]